MYANFICGLRKRNLKIEKQLLAITFDSATTELFHSENIATYNANWTNIRHGASNAFGQGEHGKITVIAHSIRNELIQIGYNVLFQDTDVVWIKNPLPFLKSLPYDEVAGSDRRFDFLGPINTGFIFTKSNIRSKMFLSSLTNNSEFFLWCNKTQPWYNALVMHPLMRFFTYQLLPENRFIGGYQFDIEKSSQRNQKIQTLI